MKRLRVFVLALACALGVSCDGGSPLAPRMDSGLRVFVHWEDVGLPQKRLEILELGMEKVTDENGIAEFLVPAGTYTLRAYDINRGGPPVPHIDFAVTTTRAQMTRFEIVDCLPCVAATARD